jgi:hypothetical protein
MSQGIVTSNIAMLVLLLAGCPSMSKPLPVADNRAGTGAPGRGGSFGGPSGSAGLGGASGTSITASGTTMYTSCGDEVSFHLDRGGPAGTEFCIGAPDGCDGFVGEWLNIEDAQGRSITRGLDLCGRDCNGCQIPRCPPIPCISSSPMPASGLDATWSGEDWSSGGTCGEARNTCLSRACAKPGRYVAHMCAYMIDGADDAGALDCHRDASKVPTCVDVPFDYPASGVVTGALAQTR